jgi:drug/metabolite transporter (DMT)-like permease
VSRALGRYGVGLALVGVAAFWGGTFVLVKDAVARYPHLYSFLAIRFAIAVVAFAIMLPASVRHVQPGTLKVGLIAGCFLTAGYVFQTWGLQDTSASKAAFITGMFVVITPLMQAVLLRRPPRRLTLIGVVAAVAGLWLLSGGSDGAWTIGDTRVLLCAVAYSAHMIVLGSLGRRHDVRPLTLVQLATVTVVCGAVALAAERPTLPNDGGVWGALVLTGVLGSAVAFAVQTYAQRFMSPSRTALILISEPAFGGLFGWVAGERLGRGGLAGSALILTGMVFAEATGAREAVEGTAVLEPALEGPPVAVADHEADTMR